MTAAIDIVLSRLGPFRVRWDSRAQRGRACCPAHGGDNPTALSIGVGDSGGVLLKCWAGCEVDAIVGALGLELHALFPPRPAPGGGSRPMRRPFSANDLIELAAFEAGVAGVITADIALGVEIDARSTARLHKAIGRLYDVLEAVHAR